MSSEKRITITPHGPYQVSAGTPVRKAPINCDAQGTSLSWTEGAPYDTPEGDYYLCRCGHSAHKPFCDGTHAKIGFDGEETAGHAPYDEGCTVYPGGTLDLLDNESLCASMRFCDRGDRVWYAAMNSASPAMRQEAIEESCNCASGRLTCVDKDGKRIEPDLPQEIGTVEDTAAGWRGPLKVGGGIPLQGADGQEYERRNRMTLCRCGESGNMPFCDTSHLSCPHMKGFDA